MAGTPSASPHPGLGKSPSGRKGSPSRQDPSPPSEGQHSEEEGQEVKDNMFLGICPLLTPKLTPSLIQNLPVGESLYYQEFLSPNTFLTATYRQHNTHLSQQTPRTRPHNLRFDGSQQKSGSPRILLAFCEFLLLAMQGNSQVLLTKRRGSRRR